MHCVLVCVNEYILLSRSRRTFWEDAHELYKNAKMFTPYQAPKIPEKPLTKRPYHDENAAWRQ